MAEFPESVKRQARSKAHYTCVVCRTTPFPQVHHILPPDEGGSNDLDNAAPLCAGCHDIHGKNPDRRKQLREMRDQWYAICESRYSEPSVKGFYDKIDKLCEMQTAQQQAEVNQQQMLNQIQQSLSNLLIYTGDSVARAKTQYDVALATSMAGTATTVAGAVHANFICPKCNTRIGLLVGKNQCPNCGTPIS
ncbi:HNH endonuclease [Chloroflexota bacterium]